MKITNLLISNVKRIIAFAGKPSPGVNEVKGKNEAGKSSVLDAIEMALTGKKAVGKRPLRKGSKKGEIVLDLANGDANYRVIRRFTSKGTTIKVEGADGAEYKSPQSLLDTFYKDNAFEPLRFALAPAKEQSEMLLKAIDLKVDGAKLAKLCGAEIDTTLPALPAFKFARELAYELRRDTNRDLTRAKAGFSAIVAQLAGKEKPERVDVAELQDAVRMADERLSEAREAVDDALVYHAALNDDRDALAAAEEAVKNATASIEQTTTLKNKADEYVRTLPSPESLETEMANFNTQIAAAGDVNELAARFDEKDRTATEVRDLEVRHSQLDRNLNAIDDLKTECVQNADMPDKRLGFDDDGYVTLEGINIEQRGTSMKILLGLQVSAALNPDLRVILIRSGNDLDADSMAVLKDFAATRDYQIWIERVSDEDDGVGFFIEEGYYGDGDSLKQMFAAAAKETEEAAEADTLRDAADELDEPRR